MPNRTYIHKSAKQVPGLKAWMDRLTLVLYSNLAGRDQAWRLPCKESSLSGERKKNPASILAK